MNVEIMTAAAQFPEKEYINGIFVTVQLRCAQPIYAAILPTPAWGRRGRS
jgi:hypothetical protein